MGDGKTLVERFDGTDFGFWKMQIEDYLYDKDLHQPLGKKSEDMKEEEWKLLDKKVMSVIPLLSRNIVLHTTKVKTTNDMR